MMIVVVEEPFKPYAEAAITRLHYLYPAVSFDLVAEGIEIGGDPGIAAESLSREIHYALYREKIYGETMSMRRSLIEAVTRR